MNILKTKQGRSVSGRDLPIVTSCLSKCARPGIAPKEMTEYQNWIQDKFRFLRSHIRRKITASTSQQPTTASGCSSVNQQVMDQFTQIRTMLLSFSQKPEMTTLAAFCNYLAAEIEGLEEIDFQTFKNEAVKLLSNIQSREKECSGQQQTLSCSSSAASTFQQTLQQPQAPASTTRNTSLPSERHRCPQARSSNSQWQ